MKTKFSLISIILITGLNAEVISKYVFTNPLPNAFKAIDNGGTKAAIDAYKDGVGAVVLDNIGVGIQIDNSAMNTLVYKYGEAAKASGSTIVDEVMYGSGTTNTKDKVLVGRLTVDGATCSDGNVATQGETWLNGNCQGGISTNGTPCNDGEPKTINDIYTNGVCAGTNVEGQSCTDNNFLTIQDKYVNGVCVGTLTANGQTCNDDNVMTVNDVYTNGECTGTLTVNGQTCSDGLIMTVNDVYTNGVCAGTLTVNGTTCTHSDVKVVNETWLNGLCTGTLTVNGATCTHSDVKVVNETWLNGVCTGTLTVNGDTCTHSDVKVVNETWLNGVCTGTLTVNGATCTHSDPKVINETWLNGVCTGTLTVNGAACNDGNSLTYGESWLNGVCQGGAMALSCKSIHTASPTLPSGKYSIDPDGAAGAGVAFPVYCDMTTDGGGWTLTHSWDGPLESTISINNVSVKGLPIVSVSSNTTTYPVLKSGTINNYTEQLVISNHPSFVNAVGNKFKYNMFNSTQLPLTAAGFNVYVLGSNVNKTVYGTSAGWWNNTPGDGIWGIWTVWGNHGICGGDSNPAESACPGLMTGYWAHYDQSYLKQIYVR